MLAHPRLPFPYSFIAPLNFQPPLLVSSRSSSSTNRCLPVRQASRTITISMTRTPSPGRISLYGGIGLLAAALTNRIIFTPLDTLALTQSRSDILTVITVSSLLLYGVGKADIIAKSKQAVTLDGFDIRQGFERDTTGEIEWAFEALLGANPNIRSCALFVNGVAEMCLGRFADESVRAKIVKDGVVDLAMQEGKRVYLADMKTVPVKEVEFGFLPSNCQAVIVQPVSETVAIVLAADKPRPFRSQDFGWLQAISDRLAGVTGQV